MKHRWVLALLLGLAAVVGWLLLREHGPASSLVPIPPVVDEPSGSHSLEVPAKSPPAPGTEGGDPRREQAVASKAPMPETQVPAPDPQAEIRGRFVMPDGMPAAGVRVSLAGSLPSQLRAYRLGAAADFVLPTVESGVDGRFAVRFDSIPEFLVTLQSESNDHAVVAWEWASPAPGGVIDVGDVRLDRAGSVRGRILDPHGRALIEGWTVLAVTSSPETSNRRGLSLRAAPNAPDGEFVIEGLPPGNARIRAHSDLEAWIDGTVVTIRAGEVSRADLRYDGPAMEGRILVVTSSTPLSVFDGDVAAIVLRAPDGSEAVAGRVPGMKDRFAFDHLAPGNYTIELRDARYLPWTKGDVQPGNQVEMPLIGNASVQLHVVEAATGTAVARYSLDVRLEKVKRVDKVFPFHDARAQAPAGGVFAGIVPVEQTLIVNAEGFSPLEIALPDLKPNERRVLEVRLARGTELAGVVVSRANGLPRSGATVRIAPRNPPRRPGFPAQVQFDSEVQATVTTDASGRFHFPHLRPGAYKLQARHGPAHAERDVDLVEGEAPEEVAIAVPPTARLVGRILAPAGASFADVSMIVRPGSPAPERDPEDAFGQGPEDRVAVGENGEFTSAWVLAGEVSVSLVGPSIKIPTGGMHWRRTQSDQLVLGVVMLAPDVDTHHDFDLRDSFPARVDAHVRVNGTPLSRAVVGLFDPATREVVREAVSDSTGVASFPRVPSGTYFASVRDSESTWSFADAREVQVEPGGPTRIDLDVALFPGELELRAGDPAVPLVEAEVTLELEGFRTVTAVGAVTDALGRLRLELPVGRWSLRHVRRIGGRDVASSAPVAWTTAGPTPKAVDLAIEGSR
jgi:hypothetical protein